jgi:peptidoglycan/LPS O-acetylase OafA/YrhL
LLGQTRAPRGHEIVVIQGLRGIASLLVCLFHLGNGRSVFPLIYFWISNGGMIGVHIFFVLSGFIIPYSMARASYTIADFPRFALKRITRIDPPYLVTIAFTLLLNYFSSLSPLFGGPRPALDVLQLLLHVGYLAAFFHRTWLSPVFWTLALEFQYYLLLGLLFPLLFSTKPFVRLASVLCFLAGAFVDSRGWFIGAYLALFLAGIVLCQIKVSKLLRYELVVYPAAVLAVAFIKLGWPAALSATFTCVMIAFVKTCPAALIFLGDISYSLYLLHWPIGTRIMNLGNRLAHGELQFDLLLLLGTAISLASSWLMYKWVELPAKNLAARITYKSFKLRPVADYK